jgi:hypothetical protein
LSKREREGEGSIWMMVAIDATEGSNIREVREERGKRGKRGKREAREAYG